MRLIEEIGAAFVADGCRVVKYSVGIRVYDCLDTSLSDQSFEVHDCSDIECGLTSDEGEFGRWTKSDRQRYLTTLKEACWPETMDEQTLLELVHAQVRLIPAGQVMSYGQVGDAVGCSAREAGWAMNQVADADEAPWQRVVGSDGYLRIGKRSLVWQQKQRALLEAEGVTFKANSCVDMAKHQLGIRRKGEKDKDEKDKDGKDKTAAGTLELEL